ncbi:MAG TPA: prepilin-type N-terminal cleavage/methylation domain-containing protein [Candidatus Rifleibacterium sp.]|nr:prepilin-type N-terminal cleavage/methylation domain-containing protein [Candidatus Rifleibacterium sp.]HPW59950.1 prepilin-type N-terminal cleavage/methylation domain-containing protein [Candidatus Rifleibacterium sp.]
MPINIETTRVPESALPWFRHRSGFSLVEVVVASLLAALFATMVFRMFSSSNASQQRASADLNMQSRVLNSQNRITRMIREGTDFLLPEIGETAPALFFSDCEGNVQVLYQLKDDALTKSTGKEMYKLMHYRVEVKNFDIDNPTYDPSKSSLVADNIKDINFLISNANTVNIIANFATENREFQTMFEVGLQNTGEME